jgi:hypothetical protein
MVSLLRRRIGVGVTGVALAAALLSGSAAVSADAGMVGAIVPSACTQHGQCPKQDEFRAGTPDQTTSDTSGDDTSGPAGDDTTPPDSSSPPAG